jgi:integrase/recombinase XerD
MTDWQKIPKAPYYVEVYEGKYKTSYRVNFRGEGLNVRGNLEGFTSRLKDVDAKELKAIIREADRRIGEAKYGKKEKPKSEARCEDLCDELVAFKRTKSKSTYNQAETLFRLHIKPFLNEHCPYAADLNATTWLMFKTDYRTKNPKGQLFNLWKMMVQLYRHAHEKGILPRQIRLKFDEGREDFRERGHVIPDEEFLKLIENANLTWRDRSILQRFTGMRPGEVRALRKDCYDRGTRTISLKKEDTKTRKARSFVVSDPAVIEVLERRHKSDSPYFFHNERDHSRPMDKHLNGWKSALRRAELNPRYTPHDLRHTYLTHVFKSSENPAVICYQAGLSLEEAQKTYLHFTAKDTGGIAAIAGGGLK